MTARRTTVSEGIYRDAFGFEAKVQVGAHVRTRRYPRTTPIKTMQAWRDETRGVLRTLAAREAVPEGTFAADATRYLETVRHLPTAAERVQHVGLWMERFGHRPRATISAAEIQGELSAWLASGLAVSTVKHYRSVLMHLFHTLDGKAGRNPVRDTRLPREPRPEPRALDYPTIERLLTAIDEPLVDARLRVLAYTGLPPAGIMRLERRDVDLRQGFLRLRPRRKGQGTGPHVVPLSRHGKAALRRFVQLDAFGPFDWSHVGKVFRRACRTLGLVGVRPYDLRHSFGTLVYEQTGDLRAAQLLLGHASQVTTTRYTLAAEARRLRIVARQIDEGLGSQLPTAQPQRKAGRISVGVARGSAAGTRRTPA